MKKYLYLLCLLAAPLSAQTLKVYEGQLCQAFDAAWCGTMTYADGGRTLTVGRSVFDVSSIDSIIVDESPVEAATVSVVFSGGQAFVTVSGDKADSLSVTVSGAHVSVVAVPELQTEMTYVLSGSSDNGSFYMDGSFKSTVELHNLSLNSATGAAVTIDNGKRIRVVLPEGTVSTLSDCAGGTQKACFFVNGHPEFEGSGTLNLTGRSRHAFASDEYTFLKAKFGTLNILSAVSDGLHVGQYFRMRGGTVNISGTGGDGIDVSKTKDEKDEMNGQLLIEGGRLVLTVASDDTKGLKCEDAATVSGGVIEVEATALGARGLAVGTDLLVNAASETAPQIRMTVSGGRYTDPESQKEKRARGIDVDGDFTFDGGDISISATGKGSQAVKVGGTYTYLSGTIDCTVQ
ncbi:MAG: carbohydrate-binding domain-containing protein [Prevotellaceae bacterium]|nr:carbohydrate-binding domain-containing protein [Prevotellaceae bacterium]